MMNFLNLSKVNNVKKKGTDIEVHTSEPLQVKDLKEPRKAGYRIASDRKIDGTRTTPSSWRYLFRKS